MTRAALAALLTASAALGQDVFRIDRPSQLAVPGDTPAQSRVLDLPPGYFFPDASFDVLDQEMRRLQKKALECDRASVERSSAVPYLVVGGLALVAGAALGFWVRETVTQSR